MKSSPGIVLKTLTIGASLSIGMSSVNSTECISKDYSNAYNISRLQVDNFNNNNYSNLVYTTNNEIEKQGDTMSVELTRNLDKLNVIENLKLGDDESITFSNCFVLEISKLLYSLKYQPDIFPNFRGNIQLEYEEDNGKYLEIEITPTMKMNIFKIDEFGNEKENDDFFDVDLNIIKEEVATFYGY